jgi:ribonuclease VapC
MVVDTSAIVAILFGEADAERFADAMQGAPVRRLSAVTRVELSFVVEGCKGEAGRADLERFLNDGGFEIVAASPLQAEIAIDAFRRFGRGRHRAGLNIGDCFSYALAAASDDTLLFDGDDFSHTDIRPTIRTGWPRVPASIVYSRGSGAFSPITVFGG